MPTRMFSSAVMFWNRRMFWKVRPIPAATTSLGRALRRMPSRARSVVYQPGRMVATTSVMTSAMRTPAMVRISPSLPCEAAPSARATRATTSAGTIHRTDSSQTRRGRVIRVLPLNATDPAVGSMIPAMTLKNVVLPAPLGPMMLTMPPAGMSRLMSRTATRPPNRLVTDRAARRVSAAPPGVVAAAAAAAAAASIASIASGGRSITSIGSVASGPAASGLASAVVGSAPVGSPAGVARMSLIRVPRPSDRPIHRTRRPPRCGARVSSVDSGRGPRVAAASSRRGRCRTAGTGTAGSRCRSGSGR